MKSFGRFLFSLACIVIVVLFHLALRSLLPPPWHHLNVIFVFLILLLLIQETGMIIWISFCIHFFIELYAVGPFGILIFSGTFAALIAFWLYQYFFTNQSWYTAAVLSFLAVLFHRVLYSGALVSLQVVGHGAAPPWRAMASVYGWEMLLTAGVTSLLYLGIARPFRSQKRTVPIEWRA